MNERHFPYHLFILVFASIIILYVTGAKVRFDRIHNPVPRVLSLFTQVPAGFVRVVDIVDARHFIISRAGEEQTITLIGTEVNPCYEVQANEYLRQLVQGKAVRLMSDAGVINEKDSDALPRYVYLNSGELINQKLVNLGLLMVAKNGDFLLKEPLLQAEAEAKVGGRGIWKTCIN